MTLKQLEKIERESGADYQNLKYSVEQERTDRRSKAYAEIEYDLNETYGAELKRLHEAFVAASAATTAERERIALTGEGGKWPIGTKLVKWETRRWTNIYDPKEKGIYEAATVGMVHPKNISSYSMAKPGEFVVRILNADGTPSKRYDSHSDHWGWYPEGVDPNDKKERKSA